VSCEKSSLRVIRGQTASSVPLLSSSSSRSLLFLLLLTLCALRDLRGSRLFSFFFSIVNRQSKIVNLKESPPTSRTPFEACFEQVKAPFCKYFSSGVPWSTLAWPCWTCDQPPAVSSQRSAFSDQPVEQPPPAAGRKIILSPFYGPLFPRDGEQEKGVRLLFSGPPQPVMENDCEKSSLTPFSPRYSCLRSFSVVAVQPASIASRVTTVKSSACPPGPVKRRMSLRSCLEMESTARPAPTAS